MTVQLESLYKNRNWMKNETFKAVAYGRVSTLLGQDVENQFFGIREYARIRNLDLVKEYADQGVSGKRERRPALDELIASAKRGEFTILLVHSIDRLERSVQNLLNLLTDLNKMGVSLVSLRENLDFTTPVGQMSLTILASVAQLEAQLISERIKTAMAVKKQNAIKNERIWKCGRPKTDQLLITKVIALKMEGLSDRAIAQQVGCLSKSTVSRIAKAQKGMNLL